MLFLAIPLFEEKYTFLIPKILAVEIKTHTQARELVHNEISETSKEKERVAIAAHNLRRIVMNYHDRLKAICDLFEINLPESLEHLIKK